MSNAKAQRGPKNKFTLSEDALLRTLVMRYGENKWENIAQLMKGRNPRQCKDRWVYYLSPRVNNSPWTEEDEAKLVELVNRIGFHWVRISKLFPGRTDTQIKNKWNVLKRRMDADVPIQIPPNVFGPETQPAQPATALYQTAVLQQWTQDPMINQMMPEHEQQNIPKKQAQSIQLQHEDQYYSSVDEPSDESASETSTSASNDNVVTAEAIIPDPYSDALFIPDDGLIFDSFERNLSIPKPQFKAKM